MATGLGHDVYLQIGREATWNSTVTGSRRFNIVNGSMNGERAKVRTDALTAFRNRSAIYAGPQVGRASISLEADYEGQLHLWDAALGTATFGANGMTVTGAGPYTWAGIQRNLFSSYSMQLVTNIPSGKCDKLLGAKLNKFTLSGSTGFDAKPVKMDLEFVGAAVTTNVATSGTPTANAPVPIMMHHIATSTFKSGNADAAGTERLRSFEFSITNGLAEYYYGADTIEEPLADEFATTELKFTIEFGTATALDEYLANTVGAPIIKFVCPTGTKSVQISMPKGHIVTPVGRPIDRYGLLTQEFTYEAIHDSSSVSGVSITIVNDNDATLT
jgi:hypothetical protein